MRALSHAQRVVSMMICRYCWSSGVGGGFGARQGQWFARQAAPPAHQPYRHIATSRAAVVLPWPGGFSPSCGRLGTGMLARLIVAGRRRKSRATFGTPAQPGRSYLILIVILSETSGGLNG